MRRDSRTSDRGGRYPISIGPSDPRGFDKPRRGAHDDGLLLRSRCDWDAAVASSLPILWP